MAMTGYNFTERVRKVLAMSREESIRLGHEYVGTEHILLGLLREAESAAVTVMRNLEVDLDAVQAKILKVVKRGNLPPGERDLPYTTRAKVVLELAMSEARELQHRYVGTEHLLLGMLREQKGIAAQVLVDAGLTLETARTEVLRVMGTVSGDAESGFEAETTGVRVRLMRPVRTRTQVAFVALWWTLGIVVLIESARPFVRDLTGVEPITPPLATLAGAEIIGALLFLSPRMVRYGAGILLAVFAVAIVVHFVSGEFPGPLLVYAAGAFYVLQRHRAQKV
jgi:hypothetical protein